jgi:adenine-specific DNA-methyltransferase
MSELNKKMLQTPDLNEERFEILKNLFPDLFTVEGKLNPDELKKIVDPELVKETERFEFKWFGKSAAKRSAYTPSKATLVYDEERSVNPDFADGNMIIEGENLETLKCLLSAYRERIKCIYIDPPYNTGNDFIYNDNFRDSTDSYLSQNGSIENGISLDSNPETDGRFHSNWLNFIYSRIIIARSLLTDDGVIFISIDDKEVTNLRKVLDEIFGSYNFVSQFIWKSRQNKDNRTTTGVSIDHEYILCYSKNNELRAIKGDERKKDQYKNPDNDARGDWASGNMVGILPEDLRPNCHYDLINPSTGINYGKPKMGWRYDNNTMQRLIEEDRILWPETKEGRPRRKVFLSEMKSDYTGFSSIIGENIFTHNGTKEIEGLFGFRAFDFPKPSLLIRELINQVVDDGDIVLDFFAGSGPTGHAVTEINSQNCRRNNFILVQIPEKPNEKSEAYKNGYKKISDITIDRNKRAIESIENEESDKDPSLFEAGKKPFKTGFKVYKLAKSNFPRIDFAPDPTKTEEENIALLDKYIEEKEAMYMAMIDEKNIFDEVLLKNGFMLNYIKVKIERFSKNTVYHIKDDYKECLICMDMTIEKETLKELEQHKDKIFICLERGLDTTMKWNLKHLLGEKLIAF